MPSVSESARAVASPIRIDVKLPGPRPTTMPSIAAGSSTTSSTTARTSPARGFEPDAPVETAQTAPNDVAVSKAKIVFTVDADAAVMLVDVSQRHARPRRREPVPRVLRPLDERNPATEVRPEGAPLP